MKKIAIAATDKGLKVYRDMENKYFSNDEFAITLQMDNMEVIKMYSGVEAEKLNKLTDKEIIDRTGFNPRWTRTDEQLTRDVIGAKKLFGESR